MSTYLDNLRPTEKRLGVGVGALVFIVLNYVFVVPYFSELGRVGQQMIKAHQTFEKYQAEIQKIPYYKREIDRLGGGNGQDVPPEDQMSVFTSAVLMQAGASKVSIMNSSKPQTHTNQFTLELSQTFSVQSTEEQLVNFLYNLGSSALIRVRDMGMHPDPPRYNLSANVKLVASYQKSTPTKAPAGTARTASATSTTKRP
jgi:hypothetical protein